MAFDATKYVLPLEEYFQLALREYNKNSDGIKQSWYGFKTHDNSGNKIPNEDRMQHQYIKVIINGSIIPSKSDLEAKMVEIRNRDIAEVESRHEDTKNGMKKLKDKGLTDNEIAAIYPCGYCPDCLGND